MHDGICWTCPVQDGVLSALRLTMTGSYRTWLAAPSLGRVSAFYTLTGPIPDRAWAETKNHTPHATGLALIQKSAWIGYIGPQAQSPFAKSVDVLEVRQFFIRPALQYCIRNPTRQMNPLMLCFFPEEI